MPAPTRRHTRLAPLLLAFLLAGGLAAPGPAGAAWISDGNLVASSNFDETTGYSFQWGQGALIAPDATGGVICAYRLGGDSLFVNRLDGVTGNRLWNGSAGHHVNPGGTVLGQPRVVADGVGGAWVVWKGGGASGLGIYAQLYTASGSRQFAAGGIFLGSQPNGQQNENLIGAAATPSGKLLVTRTDDSLRVMRVRRTGVVDWDASAGDIGASDTHPLALLADGEGAVLAYLKTLGFIENSVVRSNLAVIVNRIAEGGAPMWGLNGQMIFGDFDFFASSVSADWNGSYLFVTWTDEPVLGSVPRVRAQRVNANGGESWGLGTDVVVRAPLVTPWANHGVEMHPRVVAGTGGGCVIGWVDGRDFSRNSAGGTPHEEEIYAQRLTSGGVPQWTANGLPVDTTVLAQAKLRVVPDGGDGAIFVYENSGAGTAQTDIRARRLDAAGAQVFSSTLNDNSPFDLRQEDPSAAPDGRGGVVVAWTDLENDATQQANVRATHRTPGGLLITPTITVTAPNGGERFAALETVPIRWTSNFGGFVKIELSIAGGPRQTIANSTPNDGEFDWNPSASVSSTQLRIFVSEQEDNLPEDQSNADFAICPGLESFPASTGEPSPRDVAVADFNEDGVPDLAVAHSTGLRIHLGQGAGGVGNGLYTLAGLTALADGGRAVVTRDFNEDGILDLAVSHSTRVSILLGAGTAGVGNGSFAAPAAIALGTLTGGLVAADLNDDGVDDLAVTARASDSVLVLIGGGANGVGDGTFAYARSFPTRAAPQRLALGDFNEDGIWDLAVACDDPANPSVSVLIGNGAATIGTATYAAAAHYPVGNDPFDLETGDFDQDGITDLAVANVADGTVSVLLGDGTGGLGDGTFGPKTDYPITLFTNHLEVLDVDGDGNPDLAGLATQNQALDFLLGNGSGPIDEGTFEPGDSFGAGTAPAGLVATDVVEDGVPDVVFPTGGLVGGWKGACPTGLPTQPLFSFPVAGLRVVPGQIVPVRWTRPAGVVSLDLQVSHDNGVNWMTLAEGLTETGYPWRVAGPAGSFHRFRIFDPNVPSRAVATAAFTICAPPAAGAALAVHDGPTRAIAADMDLDGLLDVVLSVHGGAQILRSTGPGAFDTTASVPFAGSARDVAAGDFDADGIPDLAITTGDGLGVALGVSGPGGTPTLSFASATTLLSGVNCNGIAVADFDEDGIQDLALVATGANELRTFRGQGTGGAGDGTFAPSGTYALGTTPVFLDVADVNEDGIWDVVVTNNATGQNSLSLLLGLGSGGVGNGLFGAPSTIPTVARPRAVAFADMDLDGILDIVTGSIAGGGLALHRGLGSGGVGNGTFAAAVSVPLAGTDIRDLAIADFDGNGAPDVLAALGTAGVVQMVMNGAGGAAIGTLAPAATAPLPGFASAAVVDDFGHGSGLRGLGVQFGTDQATPLAFGSCVGAVGAALTAPGGAETWSVGQEKTITWTRAAGTFAVHVEASFDDGASWRRIASRVSESSFRWTVTPPVTGAARVRVLDAARRSVASASAGSFFISPNTLDAPAQLPARAAFSAAWPNPARDAAFVEMALPAPATVSVEVFDVAGRRIASLARGPFAAGRHTLAWRGATDGGGDAGPGLYFVRARWEGFEAVRRVIRVR